MESDRRKESKDEFTDTERDAICHALQYQATSFAFDIRDAGVFCDTAEEGTEARMRFWCQMCESVGNKIGKPRIEEICGKCAVSRVHDGEFEWTDEELREFEESSHQ